MSKISQSPVFVKLEDLDNLRKLNLNEIDSKEEQFNFSYIWIDCLGKTINEFCESNEINGWLGVNSLSLRYLRFGQNFI